MTIPYLNKEALNRQKLQNINQAYTKISYIQIQCKPFLKQYQQDLIKPIFTNDNLPFHCVTCDNEYLPKDFLLKRCKKLSTVKNGKFVVFPSGEFSITWNKDYIKLPNDDSGNPKLSEIEFGWYSNNLSIALDEERDIFIFTKKLFILEESVYKKMEQKLKTIYLGE